MKRTLLLIAVLFAACGKSTTGPTNPTGHDPSVQVTNLVPRPITVIWAADNGIYDTVVVPVGAPTTCIRWTQAAESVYFTVRDVTDSNKTPSVWSIFWSPWLNISQYAPFYVDTIKTDPSGGQQQFVWRVAVSC